MAHSIPEIIELKHKYNKAVKVQKGKPRKNTDQGRDKTAWRVSGTSEILDKPIQIYRQWYRFLQLAIELEEQQVKIIVEEKRVKLPKPRKDAYGHMRHSYLKPTIRPIKINWKKYQKWGNPELIANTEFNAWWKLNRDMFFNASTTLVKKKTEWTDDANFEFIKFDNRKRVNDVLSEIRVLLSKKQTKKESTSAFPIIGTPNIRTLQNRYNALVLKLSTKRTDMDLLLDADYFRKTQYGMGSDDDVYSGLGGGSEGRIMRDIMMPAKITLLSVCDGYFVKNPTKSYL